MKKGNKFNKVLYNQHGEASYNIRESQSLRGLDFLPNGYDKQNASYRWEYAYGE